MKLNSKKFVQEKFDNIIDGKFEKEPFPGYNLAVSNGYDNYPTLDNKDEDRSLVEGVKLEGFVYLDPESIEEDLAENQSRYRGLIDEEHLRKVQSQIISNGRKLIHPIFIYKDLKSGKFILLHGHNRLTATIKAGIDRIPCWVVKQSLNGRTDGCNPFDELNQALNTIKGVKKPHSKADANGYLHRLQKSDYLKAAFAIVDDKKRKSELNKLVDQKLAEHYSHLSKADRVEVKNKWVENHVPAKINNQPAGVVRSNISKIKNGFPDQFKDGNYYCQESNTYYFLNQMGNEGKYFGDVQEGLLKLLNDAKSNIGVSGHFYENYSLKEIENHFRKVKLVALNYGTKFTSAAGLVNKRINSRKSFKAINLDNVFFPNVIVQEIYETPQILRPTHKKETDPKKFVWNKKKGDFVLVK